MIQELTKQENRIAHAIASDLSQKEIADVLCISTQTVHTHTRTIRRKLKVQSKAGVVQKYLLSLENPKAFIPGVFFLLLQLFMIVSVEDYDVRKVRNGKRMAKKTVKVRRYEG
ncbi:helix-turn-helix transcriptional regulator [Tenacibaculum sp. Mcav3-52]|uniref:response regulator transcription factor n=1 Tax=Tenacibaculum sp. Mcav3-52 TaxID=2917762 RepID=UPI001EF3BB63|nr:helix-turn-helix transcriptional regulator [Tenacibaculum sp. Mcav3-52]MCG7502417.1 helix-turn-helix transcriptional regulator [Tenacibaculum sp. Mcav3-52]